MVLAVPMKGLGACFDGSHLTFPGLAAGIELKEHQKNAVWRILHDGKAFIAHPVGSGTVCLAFWGRVLRR